nr:reverse transcriptase domain-containing protein [Tanacetum cinerariifolium]
MADYRTMAKLLRAPAEGYAEAIVVPLILVEQFELKHSLINMMTSDQFFRLEKDNPHDHIRWFNKITSTIKYRDVPNSAIKLILFPFSLAGAARWWLELEPPRSITTWEDLISKFINKFFPPQELLVSIMKSQINEQTSAMTTAMTAMLKQFQATPPPTPVKDVEETCVTCRGAHLCYQCLAAGGNTFPEFKIISKDTLQQPQSITNRISLSNQTNKIKNMMASLLQMNTASTSSLGTLPSNTVANPKSDLKAITTRSGVSYDGPSIPPPVVENAPEATKDTVTPTNNETTEDVQPQVVQSKSPVSTSEPTNTSISASKPNPQTLIPYPSRRNDERNQEKAKDQIEKFYQIFKDMSFEISFTDALILMPKFSLTLKALIGNKEKMVECLALADLGASINLMPYSVWKKLSLPELTPTYMTLELADRSISQPVRVAEDVYVLADFVVVDSDADPRVPLILKRSFLKTERALIDVFKKVRKELKICKAKPDKSVVDEPPAVELKVLPPHIEYAFLEGDDKLPVIIAKDLSVEEKAALIMVLKCEDTNPCLNWEKSHFMVKEGIVLGHKISEKGIEVDKAKVDVISKLPHPTSVKGIRSFLGHAALDWDMPFELMCDASDFAIGAVLGQRRDKHFRPIHYASKTMTEEL